MHLGQPDALFILLHFCSVLVHPLKADQTFHILSSAIGEGWAVRSQNCKFHKISEYNWPAEVYPLINSYEISRLCGQFHGYSMFEIWRHSPRDSKSMGFNLGVHCSSLKFSVPLAVNLNFRSKKVLEMKKQHFLAEWTVKYFYRYSANWY